MTKAKTPLFSAKSLEFLLKAGRQKNPNFLEKNRTDHEQYIIDPLTHLARHLKATIGPLAPDYHFPQKGLGRLKRPSNRVKEHGGGLFKNWLTYSAARPRESLFTHNPNLFLFFNPSDKKDSVLVAGGLYMPSSQQTRALREAIANDASAFEKLFASKEFSKHFKGGFSMEKTSSRPARGYDPNHPRMHWLKLQAFFVWKPYTRAQFSSKKFPELVAADWKQILRLNRLLEAVVGGYKPAVKKTSAQNNSSSLLERLDRVGPARQEMDF